MGRGSVSEWYRKSILQSLQLPGEFLNNGGRSVMGDFWKMIERCETGEPLREEAFDFRVMSLTREIVQKYGIKFDADTPVPYDDELCTKVYRAAIELLSETGIYCTSTGRVVNVTSEEIEDAVARAPRQVKFGAGRDESCLLYRQVEDKNDPFCALCPVGQPVSQELFVPIVRSYVQEPLADTFSGNLITHLDGRAIKSGTPVEVEAAIWNVRKLREAASRAGRPNIGIHNFISCAERTDAIIAASRPEFGAQPNDGILVAATAELKVDYERLKKAVFARQTLYNIGGLYGPLMGGLFGGPEGTAIGVVAHMFLGRLMFGAQWNICFPIHIHYVCNTTRDLLWVVAVSTQAASMLSHMITMHSCFCAAGPCTEMVLLEVAAHSAATTVSGGSMDPVAVARNRQPNHCSGMEARMAAEVGHIVSRMGLTRKEVNEMVLALVSEYEKDVPTAPIGKPFTECYDVVSVTPRDEYVGIYEQVKAKLERAGLDFSVLKC